MGTYNYTSVMAHSHDSAAIHDFLDFAVLSFREHYHVSGVPLGGGAMTGRIHYAANGLHTLTIYPSGGKEYGAIDRAWRKSIDDIKRKWYKALRDGGQDAVVWVETTYGETKTEITDTSNRYRNSRELEEGE